MTQKNRKDCASRPGPNGPWWLIWAGAAAAGALGIAVIVSGIVSLTTGRPLITDWQIWAIPAWLFPALGALGVFGGKAGKTCGKAGGKQTKAEAGTDPAAAPRGRSSARIERRMKRDARRQAREDKRAARRSRRGRKTKD